MFNMIMNKMTAEQKGLMALAIGLCLVLGALGKLGFLQDFLNFIMIIVGIFLIVHGAQALHLTTKIKGLLKGKR